MGFVERLAPLFKDALNICSHTEKSFQQEKLTKGVALILIN